MDNSSRSDNSTTYLDRSTLFSERDGFLLSLRELPSRSNFNLEHHSRARRNTLGRGPQTTSTPPESPHSFLLHDRRPSGRRGSYPNNPVFLKLCDRRFSEQLRRDHGIDLWTKDTEKKRKSTPSRQAQQADFFTQSADHPQFRGGHGGDLGRRLERGISN